MSISTIYYNSNRNTLTLYQETTFCTALFSKGDALFDLGRYDEAIQNYDKALQIDPNDTYALNEKGDALYDLDR